MYVRIFINQYELLTGFIAKLIGGKLENEINIRRNINSLCLPIVPIQLRSKPATQLRTCLFYSGLMSVCPLIKDNLSHLSKREVCVRKEVAHLSIGVVDIIKQIPLNWIILVIPVAVDGGAVVAGHVSQLMGLIPDMRN